MKKKLLLKSLLLLFALIAGSSSVWAEDILNEPFNISGTEEVGANYNGWTVTRCWGGSGSIRLGASSGDKGQLVSPALTALSGNATLTFEVKKYGTDTGSIGISIGEGDGSVSGDVTVASSSISADSWTTKTVTITGGASNTKIKFLMTNKRMYLRNVKIVAAGGGSDPDPDPTPTSDASLSFDFTDTAWGFPSDYVKAERSYTNNGYTFTVGETSADGHKALVISESQVGLIFGKNGAKITFPAFPFNVSKIKIYGRSGAAGGVKFNIFVGDEAVSTEATGSNADHEFAIAADKQEAGTIYVLKLTTTDKNAQITKIEIYGYVTKEVLSYGWATYIPDYNVEFEANTAYVVTAASVSAGLTLEAVTEAPAGTPLLLKGAGDKTITVVASADAPATNLLEVSDGSDLASGNYPYVLAKNGDSACFKQWTGAMSTLDGRVMLVLDEAVAATSPVFSLDGEATGIEDAVKSVEIRDKSYYNLNGQRVSQPTKGLYIVNGKKYIVK